MPDVKQCEYPGCDTQITIWDEGARKYGDPYKYCSEHWAEFHRRNDAAWRQGYDAGINFISRLDQLDAVEPECPFPEEESQAVAWEIGYANAWEDEFPSCCDLDDAD